MLLGMDAERQTRRGGRIRAGEKRGEEGEIERQIREFSVLRGVRAEGSRKA